MRKKPKAPAEKVSAEDALRLRVALLELEQTKANAAKAIQAAANEAEKLRVDLWERYGLAPNDSIDLRNYAITRAG